MLDLVKKALRVMTDAFDDELTMLIEAAVKDLGLSGVLEQQDPDVLIQRAVITYCKCNFGIPDDYDRLKASYDEQKAQLMVATGYTDWGRGVSCNV